MSISNPGGTDLLAADGAVGRSGKPVRVYNITVISGATAGVGVLRNGTAATDDIYWKETGAINTGVTFNFQSGRYFPDGCFYDHDTNTTGFVISYEICSS